MVSTLMSLVSPLKLLWANSVPQEANSNETVRSMLIFRFITTDLLSIVTKIICERIFYSAELRQRAQASVAGVARV